MTTRPVSEDEPFFREWRVRKRGQHRSVIRAARLALELGVGTGSIPVLTVVGSKGKGTIAAYSSVSLASVGARVGTLTSPSLLSNRERLRVNGRAISEEAYQELSSLISRGLERLPSGVGDGYLSPTGLFTLAGVHHMIQQQCDVLVLEAGMGGVSDEVSLFTPTVLAVGAIFGEHLGVLGDTIAEIARDKIGVIGPSTSCVVSVDQSDAVTSVLHAIAGEAGAACRIVDDSCVPDGWSHLPGGLSRVSAVAGIQAAMALTEVCPGIVRHQPDLRVTGSVRLPGRLSVHRDSCGRTWVLDASVNASGIKASIAWCRSTVGEPDTVLVSLPDGKDGTGVAQALEGLHALPVSIATEHLHYDHSSEMGETIPLALAMKRVTGRVVLAVGTWSFVARLMDEGLQVDCLDMFDASGAP